MLKSSSRNGARVIWVAVHTAEGARRASDLKAYFERADIRASSHAIADNAVLLDSLVPYDLAAWTLRNGNARSDNLELCGFASWTRAQWLDSNMGMVRHAAMWIRKRCRARSVPLVKLSAADVRAGKAGVIGHVDYTNGTGDGTHWDPGPGFPWDVVMDLANGTDQEDDMNAEQDQRLREIAVAVLGTAKPVHPVDGQGLIELMQPQQSKVAGSTYEADTATYVLQLDARTYKMAERMTAIETQLGEVLALLRGEPFQKGE